MGLRLRLKRSRELLMKSSSLMFLVLLLSSCSSAPSASTSSGGTTAAPAWASLPARNLDGDRLSFLGTGEDRDQANARTKAEAMALQDLANECSLVPNSTEVRKERYEETVGILYRDFAQVSVSLADCQKARNALSVSQIKDRASPGLSAAVDHYQTTYDAPEPMELKPLVAGRAITDDTDLFVARQQLALAKQRAVLTSATASEFSAMPKVSQAIAGYEEARPLIERGNQAFSTDRPNAMNHQASAVRDSIADRAKLQQKYPATPTPSLPKASKQGGKGSHHRRGMGQQPQNGDGGPPPPGSP